MGSRENEANIAVILSVLHVKSKKKKKQRHLLLISRNKSDEALRPPSLCVDFSVICLVRTDWASLRPTGKRGCASYPPIGCLP